MDEDPRGKTTKLAADFNSRFLKNRDDTGRFIVVSKRTGKKYYVEAIGDPHIEWRKYRPIQSRSFDDKEGLEKECW